MNSKVLVAVAVSAALVVVAGVFIYRQSAHPGDGVAGPLVLYGNVDIRQVSLAFNAADLPARMAWLSAL